MDKATKEEWDSYEADLLRLEIYMETIRPYVGDFKDLDEYRRAKSKWDMANSCDAPNKPGYYNND